MEHNSCCNRTRDKRGKWRVLKVSEVLEEFEPKLSKHGREMLSSSSVNSWSQLCSSSGVLQPVDPTQGEGVLKLLQDEGSDEGPAKGPGSLDTVSVCLPLPGASARSRLHIMEDPGRGVWIMGERGIPADSETWHSRLEIVFFTLSSVSAS
ncbi:unnamed protein product [Lota lota]